MERVTFDKTVIGSCSILIAALFQIVFAKVAVNAGFIRSRSCFRKEIYDRLRTAKVGKTQADNAVGVINTLFLGLVLDLLEFEALFDLEIEHRNEIPERLLIEFLLEVSPATFIQGEFIECRAFTHVDDDLVGLLSIEKTFTRKEVLRPSELGFIQVARARVFLDEDVQRSDGLLDLASLLVRP